MLNHMYHYFKEYINMLNHMYMYCILLNIEELINAYFPFFPSYLNYTDMMFERAGKLIGATTKSLDAFFNVHVVNKQLPSWC